jgi:hypothetical protein
LSTFTALAAHTTQQLHTTLRDELSRARHGQSHMLERVLEPFYAESIRIYAERRSDDQPGLQRDHDHRLGWQLHSTRT